MGTPLPPEVSLQAVAQRVMLARPPCAEGRPETAETTKPRKLKPFRSRLPNRPVPTVTPNGQTGPQHLRYLILLEA